MIHRSIPVLLCAFGLGVGAARAQDTVHLPDVIVRGFESNTRLSETPASIDYISGEDLGRSAGTSLLPVINNLPGVRMEERSPASYRLSIRGSILGSPFGVLNVKVYWDDIPLTDPSGNTYLNVLDMNAFGSAEVLKGPAGSMYGANTGGVLLLHGDTTTGGRVQLRGGSYGQYGEDVRYGFRSGGVSNTVFESHNQSDGYRVNSTSKKDVYQDWGSVRLSPKDRLDWLGSYTNLYYQTPGGLTLQEMESDPRAARPTTTLPGASQAHAAIFAQTWYAGVTNHYALNDHWSNATTLLASGTHFDNPFLTDYETRREQTLDAVTRWIYDGGRAAVAAQAAPPTSAARDAGASLAPPEAAAPDTWRLVLGAEYQYLHSFVHDWGNTNGAPDTTQSNNRLQAFQFNPYAQAEARLGKRWRVQAGISANTFSYHYLRLQGPDSAAGLQRIDFHLQVMPRLNVQYVVLPRALSLYATVSRGYSPPTIAEIFPGTALFYNNLQPEAGWNTEVGLKSFVWRNRLQLTVSLYDFRLEQTIVPRYDSAGHAYYVNAGGTDQKGMELGFDWTVVRRTEGWIDNARWFGSYSLQDYRFRNYLEGTADYSGNPLTGVPRNVVVTGWDVHSRIGLYLNATYTYTDKISLTDAASAYASAYQLVQGKLGWGTRLGRRGARAWAGDGMAQQVAGDAGARTARRGASRGVSLDLFVGVDNALNQRYSLGDDFNAAGGRYYNPAAARNYFGGCAVRF